MTTATYTEALTERQLTYLQTLVRDRDLGTQRGPIEERLAKHDFTKREASELIDRLKRLPWLPKDQDFIPFPDHEVVMRERVSSPGMYRYDGELYKVQLSRENYDGERHLYAKKLIATRYCEGHPATEFSPMGETVYCDGSCRPQTEAEITFEYVAGMMRLLHADDRITLEEAQALGAAYGTCMWCGRTLSDPKSVEAGIGPACAKKFSVG